MLDSLVRVSRRDDKRLLNLYGLGCPSCVRETLTKCLLSSRLIDAVIAIDDMRMFGQLRPKPDARMLRAVAVGLRVPATRCVLVEDTLVHQKSARKVGMGTVWMQRFMRLGPTLGPTVLRCTVQPAYVDRRVRALRQLLR